MKPPRAERSQDDDRLHNALRQALPPVTSTEPARDLWPRMLQRLDERPIQASWLDWALLALLLVWALVFPETIPGLLYHL